MILIFYAPYRLRSLCFIPDGRYLTALEHCQVCTTTAHSYWYVSIVLSGIDCISINFDQYSLAAAAGRRFWWRALAQRARRRQARQASGSVSYLPESSRNLPEAFDEKESLHCFSNELVTTVSLPVSFVLHGQNYTRLCNFILLKCSDRIDPARSSGHCWAIWTRSSGLWAIWTSMQQASMQLLSTVFPFTSDVRQMSEAMACKH